MPAPYVPDLISMELLLAVAEHGSLNAAARALGVTQQAASQRMRTLEARTGVSVLDRSPRGSTLTRSGVVVSQWCARVLDATTELESGIAALRETQSAQLRVRASLTLAEHLVPGWLLRLRADHPDARIELRTENSSRVVDDVRSGAADLGFVESPHIPAGLRRSALGHDRLVVVVAPEHAWLRSSTPTTAAVLARTPLVAREPGSGTRQAYDAAVLRATGSEPAEPAIELDTAAAIRAAVVRGVAPAVLSELAVRDDVRLGRLRVVPVTDLDLLRPLHAIWTGAARPPVGLARQLVEIARRSRDEA